MSEELAEIKEKLERIEKYLGEDFKKKLEHEEKEKKHKEEKEVEEFYTSIIDLYLQMRIKYKNDLQESIKTYKRLNPSKTHEEAIEDCCSPCNAFIALAITKIQLEKEIEDIRKLIKKEENLIYL